jgi:ABC-type phosphate transport system substrate-binding protein
MCCLFLIGIPAASAQISVIVPKSASVKITKAEIKEIFIGAKLKWPNGNKIQVSDQPDTAIGKMFYEKVIGKSANQVRTQWAKLSLSGQATAPLKYPSDKAVKKAVTSSPHTIGYIASSALDDSVQEILRIDFKN